MGLALREVGGKLAATVAMDPALNQAVGDLSADVIAFLRRVHDGVAEDVRATAAQHQRRLLEFVRATGVTLNDLPAWQANTTAWRAVARLASPLMTTQAG